MELSVKEFEKIMQTYFDKGSDAIDRQYRPLIVANKQAGERIRELSDKYNLDILTCGQAGELAAGRKNLYLENMYGSKTAKPGALDYTLS